MCPNSLRYRALASASRALTALSHFRGTLAEEGEEEGGGRRGGGGGGNRMTNFAPSSEELWGQREI